jgi:type IV fimbrial biogenesis protein FimT
MVMRRDRPAAPFQRGFTMVELLTTLVVLAVLLALAAPSMVTFVNSSRLRASQGEFVSALMLARSEATKRGEFVGVAARGAIVAGAEFSGGWQVFVDKDRDGLQGADEDVVRSYPALSGGQRFGTTPANVSVARFTPRGFLAGLPLQFTLCGQAGQSKGYQITLEPVGLTDVKEQGSCS